MNKCGINHRECIYFSSEKCNLPDNENCIASVEIVEGAAFYDIGVLNDSSVLNILSEGQSIGRSIRVKEPILRSFSKIGGVWEVFSESLASCGLNSHDTARASLIYFLNPNEKEPVFVLKSRYGPTRYIGMEGLLYSIDICKKSSFEYIKNQYLGKIWSEVKID